MQVTAAGPAKGNKAKDAGQAQQGPAAARVVSALQADQQARQTPITVQPLLCNRFMESRHSTTSIGDFATSSKLHETCILRPQHMHITSLILPMSKD